MCLITFPQLALPDHIQEKYFHKLQIMLYLQLLSLQHQQYHYMRADIARTVFLQLLMVLMQISSGMLDVRLLIFVLPTQQYC